MNSVPMLRNMRLSKAGGLVLFAVSVLGLITLTYSALGRPLAAFMPHNVPFPAGGPAATASPVVDQMLVDDLLQYFTDYPIASPYKHAFGELGRRTKVVGDWLVWADKLSHNASEQAVIETAAEQAGMILYPYLRNLQRSRNSRTPIADLRKSFVPGSSGIVIATGDETLRFAAHLIGALRSVLGSTMPIQIAYAGDSDLSSANRALLETAVETGPPLEFLDVTTIFDDSTLRFGEPSGGWALKSFAVLGSRFEKVILVDADAVFLQPPEVLLRQLSLEHTGVLLFHDRLLFPHAFRDRHEWWQSQIRRPSATLNKSRGWMEGYSEEGDSGVVVVDKSRASALMGLLHVCWQNSYEVREEVTYRLGHGDKESWWFGFELVGAPYAMEEHYGAVLGWEEQADDNVGGEGPPKVCSFTIAHVDQADKLLWYNGGLLKNKKASDVEYEVPDRWMIDARWEKGETTHDLSCMVGGEVRGVSEEEREVLAKSIEVAKRLDKVFHG